MILIHSSRFPSLPQALLANFPFARQNELSGKVTYGGKNKQELFFEAKKYGASSLLIDADIEKPGEYCIMISNPNRVDGKIPVSCFGVDE